MMFLLYVLLEIKRLFLYHTDYKNLYCIVSQNENGLISEDSKITFRINEIPIIVSGVI